MSFLPKEELNTTKGFHLAPMIDFLFLMMVFFVVMAISRTTTRDTDLQLTQIAAEEQTSLQNRTESPTIVTISITATGQYKWLSEQVSRTMTSSAELVQELVSQHSRGGLPVDKGLTKIVLKIDRNTRWEPIVQAIVAIKQEGFKATPVYTQRGLSATSSDSDEM
jgi:biopolymer transport protein ExbD